MANSNSRPDEFSLIAELFAPLAGEGAFGLKDDAATIAPAPGHELVVTTDTILEGVDFLPDDPADTVAKKALRVNLSDLAAKGARPVAYLLSLALPEKTGMDWLRGFSAGLAADQGEFGWRLLGGDTSATPGPLSVSITAFGEIPVGRIVRRSGAAIGDAVYVTGTIGDSGGGLSALRDEFPGRPADLIDRYRVPAPRVAFGAALPDFASAALDVSDGLVADAGHLSESSHAQLRLEAERIPLSETLRSFWGDNACLRAVTAGDDYQILFTAPRSCDAAILEAAEKTGTSVSRIGRVEAGEGVVLLDGSGREIPILKAGYRHF